MIFTKSTKFHIILISLFMKALACNKDEDGKEPETSNCDNVTCLNGGECVDGTCDCPPGYIGTDKN